ncbi:fasciclin domain-containing protein [Hymenobacter latericus]|uniref:fasciclin domain-containing protein n=1 Tax=Hymenobacter sp. YIM 151858-1 TaxID=2987688 RepID=UPI0022280605|nr:fasciclin domain-containing protein [Hymenobacter sp. YIM 151858-1]UYZ59473.1 fasciclin domain-containing protein [Hymenobacter sp. YIM 151858-1]
MKASPNLLARVLTRAWMICAVLASLGLAACDDDDDDAGPAQSNIVQVAQSNSNLTTLVAAVQKADLATTLSGTTQLTVFAPTNDAFAQLPAPFNNAQNIGAITDANQIATLRGILLYHVLAGELTASGLSAQAYPTQRPATAGTNDNRIYISKPAAGGVAINGNTRVTQADVDASNGVVHVIDRVLLPPSQRISEIVVARASASTNPEFTLLLQALQRPAASALLAAAANPASNLTVFAPTDAAFRALLQQLNLTNLSQVPDNVLVGVLQLHIVNNTRAFSTDLTNNQTVGTLNGNVTIGVSGNAVTVRGNGNGNTPANVVTANVHASNGVVHVIDRVLLP